MQARTVSYHKFGQEQDADVDDWRLMMSGCGVAAGPRSCRGAGSGVVMTVAAGFLL